MKKPLLYSFIAGAALLPAMSMMAAAPGNRVFYGYNLGSAEWADGPAKTYDCGFVSYPFDLIGKGTVLKSYLPTPTVAVYAGAGIEGIIYACEYEYSSSTSMPEPKDFVAYNVFNGTLERLGQWNPDGSSMKPSDMTYSIKDDKLYAVGFEYGSNLYEVDRNTGAFTLVCPLSDGGGTLAADAKGNLYTITSGGDLYTIDPVKGKMTKIWTTGLSGMTANQSMEFDHTTGLLYWASITRTNDFGDDNVWMQEIDLHDLNNITMKQIGNVGIQSRLVALHIPYADNIDAPAAPTDITSVAGEEGKLEATISWVNPTSAFGGGELGTLYGAVIKRNGEQVAYLDNPVAGERMSWTDTDIPEQGNYRYDIQLINAKGNGAKGTAFQFAGNDRPGEVTNILGDLADDFSALTLTWDAPTTGFHLGSFDPSKVTYRVVRNDNTVVAEGLTEPTVTDTRFARLLNYNYTIYAINEQGETPAQSGYFIIGPAMELPLDQTFENEAQIRNRWTMLDANNDTFSWMFATDLGHAIFGDYELCAEYITSPTLGNEEAADEWLISPPLKFESDKDYMVAVSARSFSTLNGDGLTDETLDVHFGNKNTIEAMGEKIETLKIAANENDPDVGTMAFVEQIVKLPKVEADGVRCVGLHLVSPLMKSGYLQMNAIYIGEYDPSGVEGIAADRNATFALQGSTLFINGAFHSAAIYDAAGMKAAVVNGAVTDLSGLAPGIYILVIDGASSKIVIR